MKHIKHLCAISIFTMMSGLASATYTYDYGDAPGYGGTRHTTGNWQILGDIWNSEYGPRPVDSSDDGVSWSTDGGVNYGHGDVTRGQSVAFKFDVWRSDSGVHAYDQLKAWVDWDGDKVWDNLNESIIAEQWFKNADPGVQNKSFYATAVVPDTAALGETWLRARVSCDHVLFDDTNPYDELWQGEVEDWGMNVNTSTVPAPSALLLLGTGLAGLRRVRRRISA